MLLPELKSSQRHPPSPKESGETEIKSSLFGLIVRSDLWVKCSFLVPTCQGGQFLSSHLHSLSFRFANLQSHRKMCCILLSIWKWLHSLHCERSKISFLCLTYFSVFIVYFVNSMVLLRNLIYDPWIDYDKVMHGIDPCSFNGICP